MLTWSKPLNKECVRAYVYTIQYNVLTHDVATRLIFVFMLVLIQKLCLTNDLRKASAY